MTLEHEHTAEAIAERLNGPFKQGYIRDWVLGGIDGTVTTFAIIAGVQGANLSTAVIVILGIANIVADGFSMAASNYSGTKTDHDDVERLKAIERKHIRQVPEGERQEIRHILASKGLEGQVLEGAVEAITAREDVWIDTMLAEEYGVSFAKRSAWKAGLYTFLAFSICGAVPLLPFIFQLPDAFTISAVLTAVVFFGIGSAKSQWSLAPWWKSGLETLIIGSAAAIAAYVIGAMLKGLA